MTKKNNPHPNIKKRTPTGCYFAEISIPPNVRHHYQGRSRMRQSLETKNLEKAIKIRNALLMELEAHKAIANLDDFDPQGLSPSQIYTNTLEHYKAASEDALDGFADAYEDANDLNSRLPDGSYPKHTVSDHPTHAALNQLQRGDEVRHEAFGITLGEVLEKFLIKRTDLKPASISSYKVAVKAFGEDIPLQTCSVQSVNAWSDSFVGGRASFRSKTSRLNMLFKFAKNRGLISPNLQSPFTDLDISDRKGSTKTIAMDTPLLTRIMELCPKAHRTFWEVASFTGARGFELQHIEPVQIDSSKFLRVLESKTDAGRRIIPVHPRIEHIDTSKLASAVNVRVWLRETRAKGRLDGLCLAKVHGTRSRFITDLRNVGIDDRSVKAIVGHAASDVTDLYDRGPSSAALTEAILKLPDPFKIA